MDQNGEEITKNICYILQFVDSARFMASSLSNLLNNFLKEFIKLNVYSDTIIKNVKHAKLSISFPAIFLNIQTLKIN